MSDRPDDGRGDGADAGVPDDLRAIEAALSSALEARAGGPVSAADGAPMSSVEDERLAAIEASVAAGGMTRRLPLLGVAAAAVIVLVLGSLALFRTDEGAEVTSVGDPSTSTTPDSVTGTDPTVPAEPVAPAITTPPGEFVGVDFANFTFPASVCSDVLESETVRMPSEPFTLVDGSATVPLLMADGRSIPDGIHVSLDRSAVFGDVTADGRDDAILLLQCGLNQSDGIWPSIAVVSAVDGAPTVIGWVTGSGFEVTRTVEVNHPGNTIVVPRHEFVEVLSTSDGNLEVRWNQTTQLDPFSEQRHTTVTYGWDGQTFVPLGESDVVVIPAKEYVPPVFTPVEAFDFSSMLLALDARGRGVGLDRVACGSTFADLEPADAQLVDGEAVVRDEDGNELGAVSIESASPANLDDDELLEAMVAIRCTRGSTTVTTLVVFEPIAGPPDLLWSTTDFDGITGLDDVVEAEVGVDGRCPLTIAYRSNDSADSGILRVSYRRDGVIYVEDHAGCAG